MTLIKYIELMPGLTSSQLWLQFGSKMRESDFVTYLKKLAYKDKKIIRRFEPIGLDSCIAKYYPIVSKAP